MYWVIRTPMAGAVSVANPEVMKGVGAMHPTGRIGEPGEVAEAIIRLCSDKASLITGGEYETRRVVGYIW